MDDYYIGLMTGTSVDSLDAALVQLPEDGSLRLINTHAIPLADAIREHVKALTTTGNHEIESLRFLDEAIAQYACQAVHEICEKSGIATDLITAIGSHGQTVRHYPGSPTSSGFSLQVGDPNIIAETTGITTVADFRRRDIAAGGQGAPLVPAFHRAAFQTSTEDRVILNLGGIANITYLPANGILASEGTVLGYDTGPANTLLDGWCWKHTGKRFDQDGQWARSGSCDTTLLQLLLSDPYFAKNHPKSTGRETFNLTWLDQALLQLDDTHRQGLSAVDIQATLLELSVVSICNEIDKIDTHRQASIYACGGGANNALFMQKLNERMIKRNVATTQTLNMHPNWVEPIAFAWLAKQTIDRKPANLPSATGAKKDVILGGVYWGR